MRATTDAGPPYIALDEVNFGLYPALTGQSRLERRQWPPAKGLRDVARAV
jgi:hypothetical protein